MPTPTWEFNNTDLHNIYDAIIAGGGGGGDDLAGKLLDGQVEPSNEFGFYPNAISSIQSNTAVTSRLFDGILDPTDDTGFYPAIYKSIAISCQNIDANTASTDLSAIEINNTLQNTKKFGTTSGRTLYSISASGFINLNAASSSMVSAINALSGPIYIVDLKLNNAAGGGGTFGYSVLYYKA
jgi:hypothetical protein